VDPYFHGRGGARQAQSCEPAVAEALAAADPDTALDTLADVYPPMEPSHYARVHGIEPFERADMKPWSLHTIPTGA
jgi:hypothetical protein